MLNRYAGADRAWLRSPRLWGSLLLLVLSWMPGMTALPDSWLETPLDGAHGASWGSEMLGLCWALDRPCGQEDTRKREIRPTMGPKLSLKNTTPRKILDTITKRYPSHRWSINGGVLMLEPRNRTGKDMLGRKLSRVSIHDTISFKAAHDILRQARINVALVTVGFPRYACIDLELSNVTVREALNAIVRADGHAIWSFTPMDPEKGEGSFNMEGWGKSGVDLYHEKLGFVYSGEPELRRGCRELSKYFEAR